MLFYTRCNFGGMRGVYQSIPLSPSCRQLTQYFNCHNRPFSGNEQGLPSVWGWPRGSDPSIFIGTAGFILKWAPVPNPNPMEPSRPGKWTRDMCHYFHVALIPGFRPEKFRSAYLPFHKTKFLSESGAPHVLGNYRRSF